MSLGALKLQGKGAGDLLQGVMSYLSPYVQ